MKIEKTVDVRKINYFDVAVTDKEKIVKSLTEKKRLAIIRFFNNM